MLVTERIGQLRVIRNGVLDPTPIGPLPKILATGLGGLMDVSLHPQFAQNRLIYLTYSKPHADPMRCPSNDQCDATTAVLRARWDGGSTLTDVKDIIVADGFTGGPGTPRTDPSGPQKGPATGSYGSRLTWDKDGSSTSRPVTNYVQHLRIRCRTTGRSCGCATTALCRRTIRSSGTRISKPRRSGRSAIATRWGSHASRDRRDLVH